MPDLPHPTILRERTPHSKQTSCFYVRLASKWRYLEFSWLVSKSRFQMFLSSQDHCGKRVVEKLSLEVFLLKLWLSLGIYAYFSILLRGLIVYCSVFQSQSRLTSKNVYGLWSILPEKK